MKSFRTTNLLLLLTLFIITGCNSGFGNNVYVNNTLVRDKTDENGNRLSLKEGDCGLGNINETFIKKPSDKFVDNEGIVSNELLWHIYFSIPEDSIKHDMFKTKQKRRLARQNTDFVEGYDDNYNQLIHYDIDNFGAMNGYITGIACYPTDDRKKIVVLFYEESAAIKESQTNQTYEYDIASGALKPIECPIDPYTEDEFFDKSILTSEQYDEVRKFFPEKKYFIYADVEKNRFSMRFSAHDVFEDRTEFSGYSEYVSRYWDGKRFVKLEKK